MPYRIAQWSSPPPQGYETAKTRSINYLSYVPVPNKINDPDYVELLTDHEDGPIHLMVFVALLQFVSLQHKDVRDGWLTRNGKSDGGALSPTQIAGLIRINSQHVSDALGRLTSIGWVDYHEPVEALSGTCREPAGNPPGASNRIELNRIESKDTEEPQDDEGPNPDVSEAFALFQFGNSIDNVLHGCFEKGYNYPATFKRSEDIVTCYGISLEFYKERLRNYPNRYPGIAFTLGDIPCAVPAFLKLVRNGAIAVEQLHRIDGHSLESISGTLRFACLDTTPRNGFCWSDVINSIPRLRVRIDSVSKFAKLQIAYRRYQECRPREGTGGFMAHAEDAGGPPMSCRVSMEEDW